MDNVEILHKLVTIRVYMDVDPPKAKQYMTNWVKEIEDSIK